MFRKEYFDVIDSTVGDLQRTFMQPNFLLVRNIDLIVPMANQQHSDDFVSYTKDIYRHGKVKTTVKASPRCC